MLYIMKETNHIFTLLTSLDQKIAPLIVKVYEQTSALSVSSSFCLLSLGSSVGPG